MKIYLITGKAGSGKNYVARKLKEKLDNSIVTSLSKYIKLFAYEMGIWNWNEDDKPREFLQNTGDIMRNIDINYMTSRLLNDMEVYKELGYENIIVSDVRLLNEIEYFKNSKYDVVTIRVNSEKYNRVLSDSEKNH